MFQSHFKAVWMVSFCEFFWMSERYTKSKHSVLKSYFKACFQQLCNQPHIPSLSTCLTLIIIFPKISRTERSLLVAYFEATHTVVWVYVQANALTGCPFWQWKCTEIWLWWFQRVLQFNSVKQEFWMLLFSLTVLPLTNIIYIIDPSGGVLLDWNVIIVIKLNPLHMDVKLYGILYKRILL